MTISRDPTHGMLGCRDRIDRDIVMVDTKATTEAKKEHARKSALGTLLNTFDGVRELHGCIIFTTNNKPEDFDPALVRPGRIELMHFGRLNAISWIIGNYMLSYYARSRKRCTRSAGIISCRSVYHPERDPLTAG
jgi:hypothetical protein